MQTLILFIFAFELALLFTHEMDAIHKKEWKMFIILKDMKEERAYLLFTLLHIPLYTAIILLLLSKYSQIGFYITDIFLIAHLFIHIIFTKHPENNLNNRFSKCIIFCAGLLAIVHFVLYMIVN